MFDRAPAGWTRIEIQKLQDRADELEKVYLELVRDRAGDVYAPKEGK